MINHSQSSLYPLVKISKCCEICNDPFYCYISNPFIITVNKKDVEKQWRLCVMHILLNDVSIQYIEFIFDSMADILNVDNVYALSNYQYSRFAPFNKVDVDGGSPNKSPDIIEFILNYKRNSPITSGMDLDAMLTDLCNDGTDIGGMLQ